MKKDFNLLFVCLFVSALFANTNAVAGNWNSSSNGATAKVGGSINIFVPDDVMRLFNSASPQEKIKHCGAKSDFAYKEIERLSLKPPMRLFGYNSRKDNAKKVEGAQQMLDFEIRLSAAVTDSWVREDNVKQQRVLDSVFAWANAGALTKTKPCVKNGNRSEGCTAWKRKDGKDASDEMDHSTTQMFMMHLAYGYYMALAEFKPNDPKHKVIQAWINKFFKRNQRPDGSDIYIGYDLGYIWPRIMEKEINPKINSSSKALLKKALNGLDKLVLKDGSFKGRTTRGNRALWYHHTGLIETLVTLEMARKHGLKISKSFDKRIEKAGEIFIRGFENHGYMDKWAKTAHNSVFTPGKQKFRDNLKTPIGNAWFYIFSYRYPNSQFTKKLDIILNKHPTNGRRDAYIGFGLGCIYAVAKDIRTKS